MEDKVKGKIVIGRWEASSILINAIMVQVILNLPRTMVEIGGTAGWMVTIFISLLALTGFWLIQKLYIGFEGKDLLDLGEFVAGPFGRIFTGFVLLTHFVFVQTVILREFAEDIKVISLPVTPISMVTLFFVGGMILAAYLGLEAIVRFTAIHLPIVLVFYLIILFGVLPFCDVRNLYPVLGAGVPDIFIKGAAKVSTYSSLILIFMCFPYIKTRKNLKAAGKNGIGVSSTLLLSSTIIYIMVFRYGYAVENFLPVFQLSRLISYGRFFQRIESIFVLSWTLVAFMYLSIVFIFTLIIFQKSFRLSYMRPLILPFAVLTIALSLIPQNLMNVIKLETVYFRNVAWIVTFGLTILLLLLCKLKRKQQSKGAEES